ncbi:YhcN/YlaJ family sporulation lipoprotein [Peribacillus sp. SCS-37]|uniref:YhcN/YlaJ family sporulation lipoprotein n=1 Tax=Paraperibacillus esterisolvens TaxID=3115296 RepID=UPI0039057EA9
MLLLLMVSAGCSQDDRAEYGVNGSHPVYEDGTDMVSNNAYGVIPRIFNIQSSHRDKPNQDKYYKDRNAAVYQGDGHASRDKNYHDHLGRAKPGGAMSVRPSYYNAYEGRLTQKLERKAIQNHNVSTARAAVYKDRVIIAVVLFKDENKALTQKELQEALQSTAGGHELTVVTDRGTYSRIETLDNDLKDGGPRGLVNSDLKDLFRNVRGNREYGE